MKLTRIIRLIGILILCLCSAEGIAENYKEHAIDWEPLKKFPELYEEYWDIYGNGDEQNILTREQQTRAYAISETVLKTNPKWVDGYWILGSIAYQLGSTYNDEQDLPLAREIFVKGQKATETCLKIEPNHPLCKLFLGSALGTIGSIDGILASMKNAKKVEKLWLDVMNSGINYHFYPKFTMQGAVRYGLGIFYRLVPDMWLINWLFNVRGNLDKSIALHREGIRIDGPNACANVMLAVALLCKVPSDMDSRLGKEGFELLRRAAADRTENMSLKLCVTDAEKLIKEPTKSCGYTTSKQQDVSKAAIEEQNLK